MSRLPEGPAYYPDDMVTDVPEAFWVAELVREQLFRVAREELPHSIATRVTEWECRPAHPLRDPRRARIAEGHRHRQGRLGPQGGRHRGARAAPPGAFLELFVKVDKDWQRRPGKVERLGY